VPYTPAVCLPVSIELIESVPSLTTHQLSMHAVVPCRGFVHYFPATRFYAGSACLLAHVLGDLNGPDVLHKPCGSICLSSRFRADPTFLRMVEIGYANSLATFFLDPFQPGRFGLKRVAPTFDSFGLHRRNLYPHRAILCFADIAPV